ncbi:DUF1553 domain-containing protein [Rubinisphaera margarita]|uniref:DUF1553 domain-containing protein n=1 Tax=Rubinisphaera margarita TaxID=2909586 RepID=UPI001EE95D7F|nr:DUF1553 domain-containing protein [Rubinisphaera margarita]MCG6154430.1 DUF1553 domain-containing protein [Rubinisphaera margarita]
MRICQIVRTVLLIAAWCALSPLGLIAAEPAAYPGQILSSEPVLYLQMDAVNGKVPSTGTAEGLVASPVGEVKLNVGGPQKEGYPLFSQSNQAVQLSRGKQYLRVDDPIGESPLKFTNSDEITIEAWVKPSGDIAPAFPYIVGKGRTKTPGFHPNNQNYALRLDTRNGAAPLSFLFFTEGMLKGGSTSDFAHRWTSKASVPRDEEWHHIAVCYKFGDPKSIKGYIDGKPTDGSWDLGGETTEAPVVDDDDVWIGASMGGSNAFTGGLDEIAIHRTIVPAEQIADRFRHNAVDYLQLMVEETFENAPSDRVNVDIYERIGESRSWKISPKNKLPVWETDAFAVTKLPRKYNKRGIIEDRPTPSLIHLYSRVTLPAGQHELILRSLNSARLYIDGKLIESTPFMGLNSSAHGEMHEVGESKHGELSCPAAHSDLRVMFESDGKPHVFSWMMISGHKNLPMELGELTLAVGTPETGYKLLGPELKWSYDDAGWIAFTERERERLIDWNARLRAEASASEKAYWNERHAQVRAWVDRQQRPEVPVVAGVDNPIDRFILSALKEQDMEPTSIVDDYTFLRRLTLDIIGTNPTPEQIEAFLNDPAEHRRAYAVERMLNEPAWADHWVSYWQDVLAENPGLTKPRLNNSGPFRWYLHDAFSDNRSFDRMVTELVLMEGSKWNGGTAGFAVASNNDVPMAAKAHVIGTAFLGVEMKCARCHDAPYHESLQRDLFSMAAMLEGKPVAVPKSSSINVSPEELAQMTVKVTLRPGEQITPSWPFEELIAPQPADDLQFVRNSGNSREVLASMLTHPENERFAQVVVNRVWKRLIGYGIVEPAEDWETGEASHPEMLKWLAQEFVRQGYDLKKLTQLIVTSKLYQREAISGDYDAQMAFSGPTRRQVTAEQLVDSVFAAVGKELPAERLTYNADGRQAEVNFIDLGKPRRAWELVAISNERERPSMALPMAQGLVDVMSAYNWRSERQDPVTERESTVTPLQPMALANGTALNRAVDLSENGDLVEICLNADSVEELVDSLYLRVLTRKPTAEELAAFRDLLQPGFDTRKTEVKDAPEPKLFRSPLTWTAHFDPDASLEGIRQAEVAAKGDPPTKRLDPEWRQRVEDGLWALLNSPEFQFVP